MTDSRRFPWLSGLVASIVVALVLIARVAAGVMSLMSGFAAVG